MSTVRVISLESNYPGYLLGLPLQAPLLSWQCKSDIHGLTQLSYQIQASGSLDFAEVLAEVTADSDEQLEQLAPGGDLKEREIRYYRVRIQTQAGLSDWSAPISYEAGILGDSMTGVAISDGSKHSAPVALIRKEFELASRPTKARLYATGHGVFDLHINGVQVAGEILNPGWTVYEKRVNLLTFDVSALVGQGKNAIGIELADGWYRGKFGFFGQYDNYGDTTSILLQLEMEMDSGETVVIASDETFSCSTGEIRFADIYDGCEIDFGKHQAGWNKPGFDDSKWNRVRKEGFELARLSPRIAEPILAIAEFPMVLDRRENRWQLDAGQNIAGWVRLSVDGKRGDKVVIRHAEILDASGALHTAPLRTARATDTYVLDRDGHHVLEPKFTFHGFQYADVETDAVVVSGVAVAISSATQPRAEFISSDTKLNRLFKNVVWSQRDNFVGLPTDCPQRDERMGWTGDAQAFAYAANTITDARAFWKSWLIDLALDQDENGDVPAVVPDILSKAPKPKDGPTWVTQGRAGWGDVATVLPWSIYERFGSTEVLVQQLDSIRRWVQALLNRRGQEILLPSEMQFGDWCDPDAPEDQPWAAKVSADYVANSFFAHTLDLAANVEEIVGDQERAIQLRVLSAELKTAIWLQLGEAASETTSGCAIALEFEICPTEQRAEIAKKLAKIVRVDNGRISTGFLGTPLILDALSKNGYTAEAFLMLMRTQIRSWLYQVEMGATTIWERWDAIKEGKKISSGSMSTGSEYQEDPSMLSFNHYAYGAVADWIYKNIAGVTPDDTNVGYRAFRFAPSVAKGFTFCRAKFQTGYGEIASNWELSPDGDLIAELKVPFGVTAKLELPKSSSIEIDGSIASNGASLTYGKHTIVAREVNLITY